MLQKTYLGIIWFPFCFCTPKNVFPWFRQITLPFHQILERHWMIMIYDCVMITIINHIINDRTYLEQQRQRNYKITRHSHHSWPWCLINGYHGFWIITIYGRHWFWTKTHLVLMENMVSAPVRTHLWNIFERFGGSDRYEKVGVSELWPSNCSTTRRVTPSGLNNKTLFQKSLNDRSGACWRINLNNVIMRSSLIVMNNIFIYVFIMVIMARRGP